MIPRQTDNSMKANPMPADTIGRTNRRQLLATAAVGLPAAYLLGKSSGPAAAATSRKIEITAADGHKMTAWRADPAGTPKGGIVILHAVFGLTAHMGDVCARWADAGYTAIAPAVFDRIKRDIVHPYTVDGVNAGAQSYADVGETKILADIQAAVAAAGAPGRVAMSGFCTGGSWSWRAAAEFNFPAQVNFYGSHVHTPELFDRNPKCPTIMHYGDADMVVPMPQVERIRARHPTVEMHIYPGAPHAFLNPDQASYKAQAAALAWPRSIAFMDKHLGIK